MTNQLFPMPPRAFDRNGEPLAAAKAYVYQTSSLTAVTVTDSAGTPLAWPVIADINGTFPQMFYGGVFTLKLIITDSADVVQPGYPLDPVALSQAATYDAASIAFTPTAEAPSLTVQGALEDLSADVTAIKAVTITGAGLATGGGALTASRVITVTKASTAQAQAGTNNTTAMTPEKTAAAITALAPMAVPFGVGFTSTDQTITSAGLLTLVHALGAVPELVALSIVCQTGEHGWVAGDVINTGTNHSSNASNRIISVYSDATNIYVRFTDQVNAFLVGNKTTGVAIGITNASWKLRVRAWA